MNILIVYGGKSCEHDISVITACLAKGYFGGNIYCAYFDKNNRCFLADTALTPAAHKNAAFKYGLIFPTGEKRAAIVRRNKIKRYLNIDCAVNCCHGVNGEDGAVAGLLQMCGIPFVESGTVASGIAMDKIITKYVLRGLRFPVLKGAAVTAQSFAENKENAVKGLSFPVICKPCLLGSSIGIEIARSKAELREALEVAFHFDTRVLCEEALVDFFEINCSAMKADGEVIVSRAEVPVSKGDILTFADKYLSGEKGFSPRQSETDVSPYEEEVKRLTAEIYSRLGFSGVIRVDFIVDRKKEKVYVNEINSVPGSLAYGLWKNRFTEKRFGEALVKQAIEEYRQKESLEYMYRSDVLDICRNAKK